MTANEISHLYALSDKVECLNCISHLVEYSTGLENRLNAPKYRPVTWNGQTFKNGQSLNRHLGVSKSGAKNSIAQGTRLKGYYVKYKEDE